MTFTASAAALAASASTRVGSRALGEYGQVRPMELPDIPRTNGSVRGSAEPSACGGLTSPTSPVASGNPTST